MSTTLRRAFTSVLVAGAVASFASVATAQCSGQHWQTMGGVPGVYGTVHAMVEWDPDGSGPLPSLLVMGGQIEAAGSTPVNNIATWDGQAWSTLGGGLATFDSVSGVTSLAVHDGELYASGYGLAGANGAQLGAVAHWTGTGWESTGQLDGEGGAMSESGGRLAAVVSTTEGTAWTPRVLLWDGAQWQSLGTFTDSAAYGPQVYALTIEGGDLLAAGRFTAVQGTPVNGLARWNGAAWEDMGLPAGSRCLSAASTGAVIIVSAQVTSGITTVDHIFRNAGEGWSDISGQLGLPFGNLAGIHAIDGEIYATDNSPGLIGGNAGYPGVYRLFESNWQSLGGIMVGVEAVAQYRGQLFAGGSMLSSDGAAVSGVGVWNGSAWSSLGQGLSTSFYSEPLLRVSGGEVYAGNVITGSEPGAAIVRWNGHDWDRVLTAECRRLEVYEGDLILSSDTPSQGLRRYNGTVLEPIGPANQGWFEPYVLDGHLYALSTKWSDIGSVFRLDEAGWTQLGQPFMTGSFTSLCFVDGSLYLLGVSDVESEMNRVGRWDGTSWVAVGTFPPLLYPLIVNSLVSYRGQLILCGQFYPYNQGMAVLNGDTWQAFSSPFQWFEGQSMGADLVGFGWPVSGPDELVVAKFDGSSWRTLGVVQAIIVAGDGVTDMQVQGDGVVVAGLFATVDGRVSHMYARLDTTRCCGLADFNGDGDIGTDADISAFFSCLSGTCCPTCGSVDFNDDGDVGTDQDIEAFFRVLAGGSCV